MSSTESRSAGGQRLSNFPGREGGQGSRKALKAIRPEDGIANYSSTSPRSPAIHSSAHDDEMGPNKITEDRDGGLVVVDAINDDDLVNAEDPSLQAKIMVVLAMVALSLILTAVAPPVSSNPPPWNYISAAIGWLYFMAWAFSFVPQLYYNQKHTSVVGQSFDFVVLNTMGFGCYATYCIFFYCSAGIQAEYARRHDGEHSTVALNDVVFAVWALACCVVNDVQIYFFDRGGQRVSTVVWAALGCTITAVVLWFFLVAVAHVRRAAVLNYLDFLYGLSLIKLAITLVKYIPQIYLNFVRKRTTGWRIENSLLDFAGGILSVAQQVMDCAVTDNWGGIAGNPVKFALGFLSMIYDAIFFVQHYYLYGTNNFVV